jgi:hypothetical protein
MLIQLLLLYFIKILEEFQKIASVQKRLHVEWQRFKPDILKYAESKPALSGLLSSVLNDFDEGKCLHTFHGAFSM